MTATDVLDFIKGTCFSECGVDVMSTECREDIINRVKAHCQLKIIYPMEDEVNDSSLTAEVQWLFTLVLVVSQLCNNMGRKPPLSDVEKGKVLAYKDQGLSSREIARRIERSPWVVNNFLKHGHDYGKKKSPGRPRKLSSRQERTIIRQLSAGGTSLGKLAKEPNINVHKSTLSKGDTGQLDKILQMAITSSMPADIFKQFVSLLPHPSQTFEQCLSTLLKTVIARFRCRNGEEEAKLLYCILQRIQESLHEDSSILPQEVECLCGDSNLSPDTRLKALEILQSLKPHAVKNDIVLLYRHTQATIASAWSQPPVSLQESDVETEESRGQLFSKLLQHASAWRHLIVLKDLLNKWPSFSESNISRETASPWVQLTYRMLTSENRTSEEMEFALEDIFRSTKLSSSSIQHLVSMTEDSTDFSHLLLLCLLPKEPSLASTVYNLVHKNLHVSEIRSILNNCKQCI
ncbi:hypothetical protein C0J52_15965 [Blattella germanica]|nr:hypothetical protein C0J52_15965 [Blattella germanica]